MPRLLTLLLLLGASAAQAQTIVAAENFYGQVAREIAGPAARVSSILANPDQDPHLFEADAGTARALSAADLVISNGAAYDPWMDKLLAAAQSPHRRVIVVADLLHVAPGANPHLWYDPAAMPALARVLAAALAAANPADSAGYDARLSAFLASLQPLQGKIAAMKRRYAGQSVTATEPVFGPMAAALGLVMRNARFQIAVMNDTEPSAGDTAAFEADLRDHRVRVLLFNNQASGAAPQRLLGLARAVKLPVVGVSETEPAGANYPSWMLAQLSALDQALAAPPS